MKDFKGKIAFVTGGGAGIGLGQAQMLADAGMKVVITDNRRDYLDEVEELFKGTDAEIHTMLLDVTDREAFAAAADEVERLYGCPPQMLVLTAGVNVYGPAEASTYDDYDWILGVNLGGVINGLVTFVPRMIKAGKGGHILTTGSWASFSSVEMFTPYSASKAAVLSLMEGYYHALKHYGIGVTVFCPANVKTRHAEQGLHNRPEAVSKTGYNVNEKTQAHMQIIHEFGMDPRLAADWVKEAIENDQFVSMPYPNADILISNTLARYAFLATPNGEERLAEYRANPSEELRQARAGMSAANQNPEGIPRPTSEMAAAAGFSLARPDLDWVIPSRRAKE